MPTTPESNGTYLRFVGWIREDGEFTFDHGWETPRVTQPVRGTEGCRLTLLDRASQQLLSVRAELEHDTCESRSGHMKSRRVIGYVPLVADATSLRLMIEGRIVHEREIAPRRPDLQWVRATVDGEVLQLNWHATHSAALWYAVAIIGASRQSAKVIAHTTRTDAELGIDMLPLEGECRAVVLASDGLRSFTATSEPFRLRAKSVRICILSPDPTANYSELHGISLVGNATTAAGESLGDELLRWSVDGNVIARATKLHYLPPLSAGTHLVELRYGDQPEAVASVHVNVRPRSELEQAWFDGLQALSSPALTHAQATRSI
jgi:hypothetical protein